MMIYSEYFFEKVTIMQFSNLQEAKVVQQKKSKCEKLEEWLDTWQLILLILIILLFC